MKQVGSNGQKPAPNNTPVFLGNRPRMHSFNTPYLSPLRMINSPYNIGEGSIFDNQLNLAADFRLEEGNIPEQNVEPQQESSEESVEEAQFPKFPADSKVTKENMIEFLVDAVNSNEERIAGVRESFEGANSGLVCEVFGYLYKRFKKVKKTKEEMIKYTMRKSFKFITEELKKEDPSLIPLLTTDGLEGMSIYFTKHSEDQEIFIPFKKNSLEKTMNTSFLKKVFSVYRFYRDYRRFLKTFQNDFLKDNKKKIASMNEAVKQCLNSKNYKSLENFKRLPWTKDILIKLKEFANELLTYSPFTKEGGLRPVTVDRDEASDHRFPSKMDLSCEHERPAPKRSIDSLNYEETYRDLINNEFGENDREQEDLIEPLNPQKKLKKKSVIILTPPIHPINSPKIPDLGISLQ